MAKDQNVVKKLADGEVKNAPRAVLEDLFEDFYHHRKELYVMNLVRGIFFGFGTVIGGTLVIALLVWLLSLFNGFPLLGDIFKAIQEAIQSARR